jgi:hypothetical protein
MLLFYTQSLIHVFNLCVLLSIFDPHLYFNVFTCSITHFCQYKVTEKKFRNGFKNWCKRYGFIFSSEGEKDYMFKWFRDNHPYGREFYFGGNGGLPTVSHNDLKDHIRKFGYDDSEEAMEDLLEKSRCSNLPLMHVNSII